MLNYPLNRYSSWHITWLMNLVPMQNAGIPHFILTIKKQLCRKGNRAFTAIAPDICPQKEISLLHLKVSLASLQPMQQPTEDK